MSQVAENRTRGRRQIASGENLLYYEALWVDTFCHLRNGIPKTVTEVHGTSGMYVKSGGQREAIRVTLPDQAVRTVQQPKFVTTPDEMRNWRTKERGEYERFTRVTMGDEAITTQGQRWPAERKLWEDLKRARTPAQVRRIYKRSNLWLKPRMEFPRGGYMEWQPHIRVLHQQAEQFCQAKLDTRYPARDKRESGDYRRIEYLARVMAGLSLGVSPSYGVERLRKMKHNEQCPCWRCANHIAPRYRRSLARFLSELEHSR